MLKRLPFLLLLISCNGQNGTDGISGTDGAPGLIEHGEISIIAPCGASSAPNKEILICLESGQVLKDFSKNKTGLFSRLIVVTTGSYLDTTGSKCPFLATVAVSGNTTISWNSGKNSYTTWPAGSVTCGAN